MKKSTAAAPATEIHRKPQISFLTFADAESSTSGAAEMDINVEAGNSGTGSPRMSCKTADKIGQ